MWTFLTKVAWSCLFCLEALVSADINAVHIKTLDGTIKGFSSTVLQKPILTFLGVPFAEAPIRDLRFQLPRPIQPWHDTWDATKPAPTCIQPLPEKCKHIFYNR